MSVRLPRRTGSQATKTVVPDAATVPSGSFTSCSSWRLDVPTRRQAYDDLHLGMVLADLGAVVEVDVGDDKRPVGVLLADPADDLGHQRRAPLLQQLVVHGLIEVAEHVHVTPPQLHLHAVLESRRHRGALLLPVLLDGLSRALGCQIGILACAAERSPLTQVVPETVQVDPDLLQAGPVLIESWVGVPFLLA